MKTYLFVAIIALNAVSAYADVSLSSKLYGCAKNPKTPITYAEITSRKGQVIVETCTSSQVCGAAKNVGCKQVAVPSSVTSVTTGMEIVVNSYELPDDLVLIESFPAMVPKAEIEPGYQLLLDYSKEKGTYVDSIQLAPSVQFEISK